MERVDGPVAVVGVAVYLQVQTQMSVWACGLESTMLFQFYGPPVQCCWPSDFSVRHYGPTHKTEKVISAAQAQGCYLRS